MNENIDESSRLLDTDEKSPTLYDENPVFFRDGIRQIDYILAYKNSKRQQVEFRQTFEKELTAQGIELEHGRRRDESQRLEDSSNITFFTKVHATWDVLCKWAEITGMPKAIGLNNPLDVSSSTESTCVKFCNKVTSVPHPEKYHYKYNDDENDQCYVTGPFDIARIDKFMVSYKESFFTIAERQRVVLNILNRTKFGELDVQIGINQLINNRTYVSYFPLHEGEWEPNHLRKNLRIEGAELNKRQTLYWIWARAGTWRFSQPLELIRKYYGEKVGMYYAWLGHYTIMLIPMAVLGLLTWIYGLVLMTDDELTKEICTSNLIMCPRCDKSCPFTKLKSYCTISMISRASDNVATVAFAVIMSLWASVFLKCWERKRASLVHKWDLHDFEEDEDQVGIEPATRRFPTLIASCSIIFMLVALSFDAMFGVIMYRIIRETNVIFSGGYGLVRSIATSILYQAVISLMQTFYDFIAERLTKLEAPRTAKDFEKSLSLKLFLLQAVNYFSSTVYIAFFKGQFIGTPYRYNRLFGFRPEECDPSGCVAELGIQIGVLMILTKQVSGNLHGMMELWMIKWQNKRDFRHSSDAADEAIYRDFILVDPRKGYLTSEYLEMVMQFGFVTLFVASFPLAPVFALINSIIEIRVDAYKITTKIRRLPAIRAKNIGDWYGILKAISIMAVITNGLLVSVTSDFVPRIVYRYLYSPCVNGSALPNHVTCLFGYVNATLQSIAVEYIDRGIYSPYNSSNPTIPQSCWFHVSNDWHSLQPTMSFWHVLAGRIVVLAVFEHAVFALKLLIDSVIADVPGDVSQRMNRQKNLKLKLLYGINNGG